MSTWNDAHKGAVVSLRGNFYEVVEIEPEESVTGRPMLVVTIRQPGAERTFTNTVEANDWVDIVSTSALDPAVPSDAVAIAASTLAANAIATDLDPVASPVVGAQRFMAAALELAPAAAELLASGRRVRLVVTAL